ncbi:MAG: hypothetical protein GXO57_01580 [Thermodesulfobacteria bacterium]|nr:hypothetical protein [Thermodesulfobacteriota bacterium]
MQMRRNRSLLIVVLMFSLVIGFTLNSLAIENNKPPSETKKVTLNFHNANIKTVIKFFARINNLIPIIGEGVQGKIDLTTPHPITMKEAFRVFTAILDAKGYTLIRNQYLLKVVRKRDAVQKPIKTFYGNNPEEVPLSDEVITQIIPLKHAEASHVLNTIRPLISSTGSALESRDTNSLIITDTASNIRRLLRIIRYLDVPKPQEVKCVTKVYSIKYMKAKEMADALNKVFGASVEEGKANVKITPVETVNALIVTAPPNLHPQIAETIKRLDIRRKQVLIRVKIAEVTLNKAMKAGINLEKLLFNAGSTKNIISIKGSLTDAFVTYNVVSSDKLNAVLEMLSQKDVIHILSSPEILTSDNQKAKIIVGQEQPLLKSVTDLGTEGGTGKTVSDYVYKDVGIELEVTPHINVDRDVALDLKFKITSILAEVTFPGDVKAPLIGKREASTSVIIMDGHTLIIGGLIKNSIRKEREKVPILGDIPILGYLFSRTANVRERTELMLFITPYVVASTKEGTALTKSKTKEVGKEFHKLLNQSEEEGQK